MVSLVVTAMQHPTSQRCICSSRFNRVPLHPAVYGSQLKDMFLAGRRMRSEHAPLSFSAVQGPADGIADDFGWDCKDWNWGPNRKARSFADIQRDFEPKPRTRWSWIRKLPTSILYVPLLATAWLMRWVLLNC